MNYEDYVSESTRILNDVEYYERISYDPFKEIEIKSNELLNEAREKKVIGQEELKFIKIHNHTQPHFYHFPKIYKSIKNPPGRPIISGINSITCNMSHYLDLYLQEYVRKLPSYVKDSDKVIRSLDIFTSMGKTGLLTLDVTSLYTNNNHELGIKAINAYLSMAIEIPEAQKSFFLETLKFILDNNFFVYNESIYKQRKGTVMGTQATPSYANLFMGLFEKSHIQATHN